MHIFLFNSTQLNPQWFQLDLLDNDFIILQSNEVQATEISWEKISLVICHANDGELQKHLNSITQDQAIPILILYNEVFPKDWERNQKYNGYIDFIQAPPEKHILLQKLRLLVHTSMQKKELDKYKKECTALSLQLEEYKNSLQNHSDYLDLLSNRDGLTGLFNRRQFAKLLFEEYQKSLEEKTNLALLLLNIDYFNQINKSSGLEFGDFVLNELSARMTSNNRSTDTCFRYSGEDFIVLMPDTDLDTAIGIAEKFRHICKAKPFDNGVISREISVSIGVSSLREHAPEDHEELIAMADQALYHAKSQGRDRVASYDSPKELTLGSSEKNFITLKKTITRILEKTRASTIASLQLLAKNTTHGKNKHHIDLTQKYVQLLCEHLRLPVPIIETFKNAITLHSSIHHLLHNEIVNKDTALSMNERATINDLPYKIVEITQLFDYFSNERTILLYHSEHFDGSGYPDRLRGDAIPLGSRIFNLVDSLVAMSSDRPYRSKLSSQQIIEELTNHSGKQFDPFLVIKLLEVLEINSLLNIKKEDIREARKSLLTHKGM